MKIPEHAQVSNVFEHVQAFLDDLLASCLARGPAGRGWGEGKLILNVDLTYSKSNLNLI